MKKYLFVTLFALMLVVSGCGKKNQVVCSKTTEADGKTYKEEAVFELDKDNKVTKASGKYTFSDKESAETYCNLFKSFIESDYIKCTDKEIEIVNLEKIAEDSEDEETTKILGMTKDEIMQLEQEEGYTCK